MFVLVALRREQGVDGLRRRAGSPPHFGHLGFADQTVALPVVGDDVAPVAQGTNEGMECLWRGVAVDQAGQVVAGGRPQTQASNDALASGAGTLPTASA